MPSRRADLREQAVLILGAKTTTASVVQSFIVHHRRDVRVLRQGKRPQESVEQLNDHCRDLQTNPHRED